MEVLGITWAGSQLTKVSASFQYNRSHFRTDQRRTQYMSHCCGSTESCRVIEMLGSEVVESSGRVCAETMHAHCRWQEALEPCF